MSPGRIPLAAHLQHFNHPHRAQVLRFGDQANDSVRDSELGLGRDLALSVLADEHGLARARQAGDDIHGPSRDPAAEDLVQRRAARAQALYGFWGWALSHAATSSMETTPASSNGSSSCSRPTTIGPVRSTRSGPSS